VYRVTIDMRQQFADDMEIVCTQRSKPPCATIDERIERLDTERKHSPGHHASRAKISRAEHASRRARTLTATPNSPRSVALGNQEQC